LAKNFKDLSEQEILAVAISSEETYARIYADFAAGLKTDCPGTAQIFKIFAASIFQTVNPIAAFLLVGFARPSKSPYAFDLASQ
jgi:hypothetical protein